jgi:DNA adenine methylase
MRYLGGKHKIGEKLSETIIKKCPPDSVDGYLEPFCGSLGVFKHMTDKGYKKCVASDIMPDLVQMWRETQNNTLKIPDTMNETLYKRLKESKGPPNAQRAIAGFFLSFGGKYFGGYAQKWEKKGGKDYLQTFRNGIAKIQPSLSRENVVFEHKSYLDLTPKNMCIYCDPPYKNTEGYSANRDEFDSALFWETMRKWSKDNMVFISEQTCPPDFQSVWSHLKKRTLTDNLKNRKVKREHLFVYNPSQPRTHKTREKQNKTHKNRKQT